MSLPWFRVYADFMTDWRIEALAFEDQRHFVFILCAKCAGYLDQNYPNPAIRDRSIGRRLGLQGEALENAKARLLEVGLIDGSWQPKAWEKRQAHSDNSKDRVRKFRENKEKNKQTVTVTVGNGECNGIEREGDIDKISVPNGTVGESPRLPPCPYDEILEIYQKTLPTLGRVVRLTPSRKQQIRARWNEGNQDLDGWRQFFEHVSQSDFLMGRTKPRSDSSVPFQADLEWLTKAGNWIKVIEGKYHHG